MKTFLWCKNGAEHAAFCGVRNLHAAGGDKSSMLSITLLNDRSCARLYSHHRVEVGYMDPQIC